jgi:hypothetical protein
VGGLARGLAGRIVRDEEIGGFDLAVTTLGALVGGV